MTEPRVQATAAHAAPFLAWLALMTFLDVPQIHPAWQYAVRSVVVLALLLHFRPWRWYAPPCWRHVPLGVGAGLLVAFLWVAGESPLLPSALRNGYETWCVLPLGHLREPLDAAPYAPGVCGWPLTLVRLLGSGVVVALAEEFFWRGFLYRWILGEDFLRVDPGTFDRARFLAVAVVFGVEHAEWLAGILAGLIFGALYLRTRNLWPAILAHAVANLALGAYVIGAEAWVFW